MNASEKDNTLKSDLSGQEAITTATVDEARNTLDAAIDAITAEVTMPGELDAVDAAIDALLHAVRAEQQATIERLTRELGSAKYALSENYALIADGQRANVEQNRRLDELSRLKLAADARADAAEAKLKAAESPLPQPPGVPGAQP